MSLLQLISKLKCAFSCLVSLSPVTKGWGSHTHRFAMTIITVFSSFVSLSPSLCSLSFPLCSSSASPPYHSLHFSSHSLLSSPSCSHYLLVIVFEKATVNLEGDSQGQLCLSEEIQRPVFSWQTHTFAHMKTSTVSNPNNYTHTCSVSLSLRFTAAHQQAHKQTVTWTRIHSHYSHEKAKINVTNKTKCYCKNYVSANISRGINLKHVI